MVVGEYNNRDRGKGYIKKKELDVIERREDTK